MLASDALKIMACASICNYSTALSYALSCIGKQDLVLKYKQLETLKYKQLETLKYLYDGNDVFLWVPTGYGKSLCFQTLPFLFDAKLGRRSQAVTQRSVVLVVSPLVSLMVNQVSQLQSVGVAAAILSGNTGVD